ncbi:hypothetical protein SPRG_05078 [Saprolegnia parasitica CBS 223.65]|uniref:Uncharacterized protein n=1 Tax=Saprolegnia parasitica (strain CBS 223.65) TaxID=695850 RepID=A0A067CU99_SAPPC|nr:hypothetical protein SPRG_05078 [Saprolegnia parasitica CBS 223.65]KDO30367.1 hypothetical protein SPRG_05078 [Saprolegnia parasitica CBS 223.65]|eukprot:XP_012198977.1 hypothetical protein SPRG_05078 [Saprolegnia parasitica CBS 223.65]
MMDRDAWKARGNACVQAAAYADAIAAYNEALKIDGDQAGTTAVLCNRAFAWLQLATPDALQKAVTDCSAVLSHEKANVKALFRRASARQGLQQWQDAKVDLEAIIALEPGHPQALEDLDRVRIQIAAMTANGLFDPSFQAKMLASIASGEAIPSVAPLPPPAPATQTTRAKKASSKVDEAMADLVRECSVAATPVQSAASEAAWRELQAAEHALPTVVQKTKSHKKKVASQSSRKRQAPPRPSAKTDALWQALLDEESSTRTRFTRALTSRSLS